MTNCLKLNLKVASRFAIRRCHFLRHSLSPSPLHTCPFLSLVQLYRAYAEAQKIPFVRFPRTKSLPQDSQTKHINEIYNSNKITSGGMTERENQ